MSIKYNIHTIKNVQGTGSERRYVHLLDQTAMTQKQLEDHLHTHAMLTRGEVQAVLTTVRDCMLHELAAGHRFYMPGIGYFSLSVACEVPQEVPSSKVRGNRISVRNVNFRPEAELVGEVRRQTRFERVPYTTASRPYTEHEMTDAVTAYLSANPCVTRRIMETEFGLRRSMAGKWLKRLTESGVLVKTGPNSAPVYLLAASRTVVQPDGDSLIE